MRGLHTHPLSCHLICVSFCTTHPKKWRKKNNGKAGKKKRNENPLWFLAITRQQPRLSLATKHGAQREKEKEGERERLACSHATCHTHSHTQTVAECSYIYAHIARQRSATHIHFSNAFLMPHTTRSRLYLAALLPGISLFPAPALIFISLLLWKVSTTYAILRKMQSMRIDKINKYENLRQNFFVFWQFT